MCILFALFDNVASLVRLTCQSDGDIVNGVTVLY